MVPVEYEQSFRDNMTFLLTKACQPGGRVERHVAEALSRFFVLRAVHVMWSAGENPRCVRLELGGPARFLEVDELARLRVRLGAISSRWELEDLQVSLYEADPMFWAAELSAEHLGQEKLLLMVDDTRAQESPRVKFFRSYLTGQRELYAAVKALHSSAQLAEWSRDIERITGAQHRPLAKRFAEASALIGQMAHRPTPETVALVERLAIWAMQQHLGSGWRVRRFHGRLPDLRALVGAVRTSAERWASYAESGPDAPAVKLCCFADILSAEDEGEKLLQGEPFGRVDERWEGLELLRRWTLAQEQARRLWRENLKDEGGEAFSRWLAVAHGSRSSLTEFLAKSFALANADAAHLRNWLRLWLCLELDWTLDDEQLSNAGVLEPWRWRADLAYVLREGLRFACFGDRPDYLVQPDALSESLRTLVEYHALSVVGVPNTFDVRWILIEIARVHRADEYGFMTGHLQHVLEVYIFGNFLCSLLVQEDGAGATKGASFDGWTLGEVLASRGSTRDPVAAQTLRQAFCVASLFHDVGMILFPRYPELSQTLSEGRDDGLHRQLSDLSQRLKAAGLNVSAVCAHDLRSASYWEADDSLLHAWMARKSAVEERPDHALLGAWFLHRLYHRYGDSAEVLRQAVRAVLLHQVIPQPIHVDRDPAAALLALADEVFEWDPYFRLVPVQDPTSRSLHTMAVAMPPDASRAQRVDLRGTEAHAVSGKLQVTIQREGAANRGWPQVTLTLKHPELLDGKVHHYWLTMAQNLGRIRPFRGFSPEVEVRSTVPPWLDENGGTRQRLIAVFINSTLPIATPWRTWLTPSHRFGMEEIGMDERGTVEVVHLGALERPFEEDVREHMQRIDLAVDAHPPESRRPTVPPPPSAR